MCFGNPGYNRSEKRWQEMLAVDKPVLLLVNMKGNVFTEYGEDILKRMIEQHLVFENGFLLVKYIEGIEDTQKWWCESDRHLLVEEFCKSYMYISDGKIWDRYKQLSQIFFSVENNKVNQTV